MAQTAQKNDRPQSTEMPVGEILRRTRLHYKQSIADIESALRIRADQIESIERGDMEKLPGRVYAIGFIRTYSEYLGLDGDKMVQLFKTQCSDKTGQQQGRNFSESDSDNRIPPSWLVLLCLALVAFAIALWSSMAAGNRDIVESIPEAPKIQEPVRRQPAAQAEQTLPEHSAPAPAESHSSVSPKPADFAPEPRHEGEGIAEKSTQEGIILNIDQNSWIEIKDQTGKSLLSRVLQAGDRYFVPDRPDLFISIGNAGGVSIEVDGVALRPLGRTGDVLRNLKLDAEFLKNNFMQEAGPPETETGPRQKSVESPL